MNGCLLFHYILKVAYISYLSHIQHKRSDFGKMIKHSELTGSLDC